MASPEQRTSRLAPVSPRLDDSLLGREPQYSAPAAPMASRQASRPLRKGADLVEDDASASWTDCLVSGCCGDSRRHQAVAASDTDGPYAPPPAPQPGPPAASSRPLLDFDLASPEGQAVAQLAGGAWVSQVLCRLWPYSSAAIEQQVQAMVPDLVEANKPPWMEGVTLDRFSLGATPPVIKSVHVDKVDDDGLGEVRLMLELEWNSSSDIQVTVMPLPASITNAVPRMLRGAVKFVTSLTAGIQQLKIKAQLMVALGPLVTVPPVVKAVAISLMKAPEVDFDITLTKGETHVLNLVKPWLRSTIAAAFAPYVLPERVGIPMEPGAPDSQKPEGILQVRVVSASGLPKTGLWGTPDPYVDLWVRGRIKRRTPTVQNCPSPTWPEAGSTFRLLVNTRQYQSLTLEVWDEDNELLDARDDFIGAAQIKLRDLQPDKEQQLELQLVNNSNLGEVDVDLDEAHAGGSSRADVSNVKLHVVVKYIPACMACNEPDIGCPGLFNMKLTKVKVPSLDLLPLRARPYLTGQPPAAFPPLSFPLRPLQGLDPVTKQPQAGRLDIPFLFDAVWDVMSPASEVARAIFVLELVRNAGRKNEEVASRLEVPLASIIARKPANAVGGVAGGHYTLKSDTGFEFELELLWNPLLDDGALATSMAGHSAQGLQQLLLPDNPVTVHTSLTQQPLSSQGAVATPSQAMPGGEAAPEKAVPPERRNLGVLSCSNGVMRPAERLVALDETPIANPSAHTLHKRPPMALEPASEYSAL